MIPYPAGATHLWDLPVTLITTQIAVSGSARHRPTGSWRAADPPVCTDAEGERLPAVTDPDSRPERTLIPRFAGSPGSGRAAAIHPASPRPGRPPAAVAGTGPCAELLLPFAQRYAGEDTEDARRQPRCRCPRARCRPAWTPVSRAAAGGSRGSPWMPPRAVRTARQRELEYTVRRQPLASAQAGETWWAYCPTCRSSSDSRPTLCSRQAYGRSSRGQQPRRVVRATPRWSSRATGAATNPVPRHPATRPPHPVTRSPGHPVTRSPGHPVTRSPANGDRLAEGLAVRVSGLDGNHRHGEALVAHRRGEPQ